MGTRKKKVKLPQIPFIKKEVENAARITVEGFENYNDARGNLFDKIRESLEILDGQKNPSKAEKEYKSKLAPNGEDRKKTTDGVVDRSTLNKIIKICRNDVIVENLYRLPESWGTLAYLATEEVAVILEELIDQKAIGVSFSLSECKEAVAAFFNKDLVSSEPAEEPQAEEKGTETEITDNPLEDAVNQTFTTIEVEGKQFTVEVSNTDRIFSLIAELEGLGVQLSSNPDPVMDATEVNETEMEEAA